MSGTVRSCQRTAKEGPPPPYAFLSCAVPPRRLLPLAYEIRAPRIQHGQPPPARRLRPCGCNCSGQKTFPRSPPPPCTSAACPQAPMARAASPLGKATTLRFPPPHPPPSRAASGRRYSCEAGHPSNGRGGRSLRRQCRAAGLPAPPSASLPSIGAASSVVPLHLLAASSVPTLVSLKRMTSPAPWRCSVLRPSVPMPPRRTELPTEPCSGPPMVAGAAPHTPPLPRAHLRLASRRQAPPRRGEVPSGPHDSKLAHLHATLRSTVPPCEAALPPWEPLSQ